MRKILYSILLIIFLFGMVSFISGVNVSFHVEPDPHYTDSNDLNLVFEI